MQTWCHQLLLEYACTIVYLCRFMSVAMKGSCRWNVLYIYEHPLIYCGCSVYASFNPATIHPYTFLCKFRQLLWRAYVDVVYIYEQSLTVLLQPLCQFTPVRIMFLETFMKANVMCHGWFTVGKCYVALWTLLTNILCCLTCCFVMEHEAASLYQWSC